MVARNALRRIVAVFIIVTAASYPAFATPVYIYGGDFNLPIPKALTSSKGWMADAVIAVNDHHIISDIDVSVSLAHTNVFDLQIFLKSPAGTTLCLNMYNFDEFFIGENYIQTIFDDEAQLPIEQAQSPFTGRFRPKAGNPLEVFDGQDIYGLWRLRIYDAFEMDRGSLQSFKLMINNPEPSTVTLLMLGSVLISFVYRSEQQLR